MMFSEKSKERLLTCHLGLQQILQVVMDSGLMDFSVLCGHRNQVDQDAAFAQGVSGLKWPESRHNSLPSTAVDVAPYPIDWKNLGRFHYLAGLIMGTADRMGIKLEWGGHWTSLVDMPHFQLVIAPETTEVKDA